MIYRKKTSASAEKKCDVFISYRRDGGDMAAMHFYQALKERGYTVFFDLEVLRTGKFNEALLSYIDSCQDFLLILSPHALDRCDDPQDWVRQEIARALKLKKNIIPVMLKGFNFPERLPGDIVDVRFQNGLSSSTEYFEESLERLCKRYLHSRPAGTARLQRKLLVPGLAAIAVLAVIFGAFMGLNRPKPVQEIIEVIQVTEAPAEEGQIGDEPVTTDGDATAPADTTTPEAAETPVPEATAVTAPEAAEIPASEAVAAPASEPSETPESEVEVTPSPEPGPPLVRDTDFPVLNVPYYRTNAGSTEDVRVEDLWDTPVLGHPTLRRRDVGAVRFLPSTEDAPQDAWDVSMAGDGGILAWMSPREGDALYDLTIAGTGGVKLVDGDGSLCLFAGFNHVERVDFNGCVDSSALSDFAMMFLGCERLESIDFNGFCTARAYGMYRMFEDCRALRSLDLSTFETERVEYMDEMFMNCESLETLDISGFSTGRIEAFDGMFQNCASLKSLDLSRMNTSLSRSFSDMFNSCASLETLDLSAFDTSRAIDMTRMFKDCAELDNLEISGFDTSRVQSMREMFANCYTLDVVDVSHFDTQRVEDMTGMFSGCTDIPALDVSHFDTSRVTSMKDMFANCMKLDGLDLSKWQTSNVFTMEEMFENCAALYKLDLNGLETERVKNMSSMFVNCVQLVEVLTTSWDVSDVENMDYIFAGCMFLENIGRAPASLLHGSAEGAFDGCCRLEGQASYIPPTEALVEVNEEG